MRCLILPKLHKSLVTFVVIKGECEPQESQNETTIKMVEWREKNNKTQHD